MRLLGLKAFLWAAVLVLPGGVLLAPLLVALHRRRRRPSVARPALEGALADATSAVSPR